MTTETVAPPSISATSRMRLGVAWSVMLLTSALPAVLLNELGPGAPAWLLPAQIALLGALLVATFVSPAVRPLRALALVLLAILGGAWAVSATNLTSRVQALLPDGTAPFTATFLSEQVGRLLLTVFMIVVLWLIFGSARRFFLTTGDLDATAAPIKWIGVTEPTSWNRLAPIAGLLISLGTFAFVWLAARPTMAQVTATLPLLPVVVLVSALNAFHETITYRASFLAALEMPVGAVQALLMAALWFGIGHYYGVPYGVLGAAMATFLGWFLGRSVLETRGIFWAWGIHFLQDVVIFFFLAMGAVVAGGG